MAEPAVLFDTILETSILLDDDGIEEELIECCKVCGNDIKMMSAKGTGACGQLHQRVLVGQLTLPEVDRIVTGAAREDGLK